MVLLGSLRQRAASAGQKERRLPAPPNPVLLPRRIEAVVSKKLPWTCQFPYVDAKGAKQVGRGRTFYLDDKKQHVDLFPSSVLAAVLHRELRTIYKWETAYAFPRPLYTVEDDKLRKRWYSRAQIEIVELIYNRVNRLRHKNNEKDFHAFIFAVQQVFYTADAPTEKRTPDHGHERRANPQDRRPPDPLPTPVGGGVQGADVLLASVPSERAQVHVPGREEGGSPGGEGSPGGALVPGGGVGLPREEQLPQRPDGVGSGLLGSLLSAVGLGTGAAGGG